MDHIVADVEVLLDMNEDTADPDEDNTDGADDETVEATSDMLDAITVFVVAGRLVLINDAVDVEVLCTGEVGLTAPPAITALAACA